MSLTKNKINVYQISPNQADITSFYRGTGPYGKLAQQYSDLEIRYAPKLEIDHLFWCDILVIQRPFTTNHLSWINSVKQLGKPVIIDYDDDVTNVPTHNPHQKHYNNELAQFAIKSCLNVANAVTVSTESLKAEYLQHNKNVHVIPNAVDNKLLPDPKLDWTKRRPIVLWRGGESHTHDLLAFKDQISNVVANNPKWMFEFFGGDETFMQYVLKPLLKSNTHFTKSCDMLQYLKNIQAMTPSLMIVPLCDDKFNQAKSNIAWIEGTMIGATVVAPNMTEWQKPGVITYSSKEDFEDKVNYILSHPNEMMGNWKKSFNHIKQNLQLEQVNEKRYELIRSMV